GAREHEATAGRLQAAETAAVGHHGTQQELAGLRQQLSEMSGAHERLREEAAHVQASLASAQALLAGGERERAELQEKVNHSSSQNAELAAARTALENQQQRLSKLQSQLDAANTERDSLRINSGHAIAELNELRAESVRQK